MDKLIAKVIKNNKDVVDFLKEQLEENPELSTADLKERVYQEYKYMRFAGKTVTLLALIGAAREGD